MPLRNTIWTVVILAGLLPGAHPLSSQTSNSPLTPSLSGVVVDASGAVIPAAVVQICGLDGSLLQTTQTGRDGSFAIFALPAGDYRLLVSKPGFDDL